LPVSIRDGETTIWDQRFRIRLPQPEEGRRARRFKLAPFDPQFLVGAGRDDARARAAALPSAVRLSLPALYDRRGLVAVPHLNYGRAARNTASVLANMVFLPARPVTFAVFSVV
jgi:hypothetical protein